MFSIQLFFIIALISCVTQKSFTKKKYHFVTVDDYDNLYIHVYVKPGCKKNKITDMDFSSISVDITTKDVGKECNEELIKYLAKVLQIKEDYLSIEKAGNTSSILFKVDNKTDCSRHRAIHNLVYAWELPEKQLSSNYYHSSASSSSS
ncbi:UPF0235 protein C15orf40 homolog isoform X1 [Lycorma delicatula]|uniref:UPF0235 protein C15orf40 homolog isoform X1 n=1 Tax=Lycorma delicatula TaxID=130591 RepID=UPI003F50F76D